MRLYIVCMRSDEFLYFKKKIRSFKIKAGEHKMPRCDESKCPKVHISMGLVFAVSHLKTHRQQGGGNVGEE